MPHPSHEQHLCLLQDVGYLTSNLAEYKKLLKEGKYVCKNCGRAAANEKTSVLPKNYSQAFKDALYSGGVLG